MRRLRAIMLLLALAGCAAPRPDAIAASGWGTEGAGLPGDISCVPFARELSGIALAGDAHRWWAAADGRYARSAAPAPGAVLVFRRTAALPQGHLAVVVRQVGPREVLVTHANWGSGADKGRVAQNQRVVDVSARNDWTSVRVWHPPTQTLGVTIFQSHGFILPAIAADPVRLAANVPRAARAASGTL